MYVMIWICEDFNMVLVGRVYGFVLRYDSSITGNGFILGVAFSVLGLGFL